MKNLWKEKGKAPQDLFDVPEGPVRLVLGAVAMLALIFLAGSVFLMFSGAFARVEILGERDLPEVTAVVTDYQGPLWGLENTRKQVDGELGRLGLSGGPAITLFPESPLKLRALAVECSPGYILPLGYPAQGLSAALRTVRVKPGRRLVARIRGKGNYTGLRAYRAAAEALRKNRRQPAEGEWIQVKVSDGKRRFVEHWIPVQ